MVSVLQALAALDPLADKTLPERASRAARFALRVVQCGAIAVVLAASTHKAFELDRFLVPKELVLHIVALLAGTALATRIGRTAAAAVDLLLLAFVVLSAVSALGATNSWLAFRAVAISVSAVVLFRVGRELREAGLGPPLLRTLAFATVLAAVTSLLETYGVRLDLFATTRVPGGALGNRNFVAHAAAFGLPLVLFAALRASTRRRYLAGAAGAALVTATLVLTRSRAAWLAVTAVVLVLLVSMIASAALRRHPRTWLRLAGIVIVAGAAVAAALLLPNSLRWRSDNPYLETVRGVASYDEGSGQGRLIQYGRSLRMTLRHPLFGVGPGNWPVAYPAEIETRRDPSLDPTAAGMTSNPWPSSDWIAYVSERGALNAALLAVVLLMIAGAAFAQLRSAFDSEQALRAMALLGTLVAACVAGAFDAVLLLALPTLLVWTALGALTPVAAQTAFRGGVVATLVLIAVCAAGVARSASQLVAMELYATRHSRGALEQAARIDPGNYRLRLRLARGGTRRQRCEHARAAHALFPAAAAARELSRRCGD